ncbi:MAG: hypothetical protein WBP59_05960 [Ilumatobacteraceae bacterium]
MSRRATRLATVALGATLAVATLTACAETVVEVGDDTSDNATPDETAAPTTTEPIVGSTSELLTQLSEEMSQLSSQVSEDGNHDQATLLRIDAIWATARPDVEATDPGLVDGIDTSVSMARTSVVRIRPADADRAFSILVDLVERYDAAH